MLLRVTFSSYNSFLLCVFFPERLGPKARFSDYNVSPFTPFFISRNTRNVCNLCPSQMWTCRCLLPLRKSLALLQQGRLRKMNREAWSPLCWMPPAFSDPCYRRLRPFPLLYQHPYNYDVGLWHPAGAFKCHYWCLLFFSLGTKEGLLSSQNSGNSQDSTQLGMRSACCIVRWLPATWPKGLSYWGNRKSN